MAGRARNKKIAASILLEALNETNDQRSNRPRLIIGVIASFFE
jgi:hypothetical protein